MNTERIDYANEQEWLVARTKDLTSTDIAALPGLDVSPYLSPWELFQRKKSGEVPQIAVNERMQWGLRLQDAIAYGVAQDMGLDIRRLNSYIRMPLERVGSSFDFEILGHGEIALMEIKNVDGAAYRESWIEEDDNIEAPPHIELQVQHQLLVSNRPWALLVALVGGNTVKVVRRERNVAVGEIILEKAAEFWSRVERNDPPPADFSRDARAIAKLYNRSEPGKVIEINDDVNFTGLVTAYKTAQAAVKAEEVRLDELKARMLERIGTAERATGPGWSISAKEVAANPGTVVTPEMVGNVIGARNGYRGFRVEFNKRGGKKK